MPTEAREAATRQCAARGHGLGWVSGSPHVSRASIRRRESGGAGYADVLACRHGPGSRRQERVASFDERGGKLGGRLIAGVRVAGNSPIQHRGEVRLRPCGSWGGIAEDDGGVGWVAGERSAQYSPQAVDISACVRRLAAQELRRLIGAAARTDTDVGRRERQTGPQVCERHTLVWKRDQRVRGEARNGREGCVMSQQVIERVGKLNADGEDKLWGERATDLDELGERGSRRRVHDDADTVPLPEAITHTRECGMP